MVWDVWRTVVLGKDAGAVVGGEEEDGVDGEEGHVGCHFGRIVSCVLS